MQTRIDLILYLIKRFGYEKYLEIGCQYNQTFSRITICKVGVDPMTGGTLRISSDDFFAINAEKFDIIFIDGLHLAEQVEKDINNSLKTLNEGGIIVIHDCNPQTEQAQKREMCNGAWNGDVWKAFVKARKRSDIDCYCMDLDFGCGLILNRENRNQLTDDVVLDWLPFSHNKQKWLNLVKVQDIENIF